MQNIRKWVVVASLIVAAGIGAALFFKLQAPSSDEATPPPSKQILQDSTTGLPTGISYEFASSSSENKHKTAQNQLKQTRQPIPDLSRPISPVLRQNIKTEMEQIIGELKKNPSNAALWSELGLYRKESGDYEGARQAWEFAWELQPENAVIADNLGVLYGYYLKNGLKSEEFFRAAVALEPKNIHLRLRLFELYRDVFEDKAKARTAIEDALKDNPGNEQLAALLKEI